MKLRYSQKFREVMIQGCGYFTCNPTVFYNTMYYLHFFYSIEILLENKYEIAVHSYGIVFSEACWIVIGR